MYIHIHVIFFSDQVCSEIEHQKEQLERASQKKGETAWHFLEIIDRALMELKSEQKKWVMLSCYASALAEQLGTTSFTSDWSIKRK